MSPARLPARARVLMLEDSDLDAELISVHLGRSRVPLDVVRVAHRREYERLIAEGGFDVVLADYSLPDFDGLSALQIARERWPDVPFIFVSGVVGEEFATEALRVGATDYVLKRNLARLDAAVLRALVETSERERRRLAEAALGTSEANMRLAIEAAGLGMWHYRPGPRRFVLDTRCQSMFGLDGTPGPGYDDLLERSHPDDRASLDAAFRTALLHGAGARLLHEGRTIGEGGREHWIVMRGEVMADLAEDGGLQLLGVLQEVTEQKLAAARQRHHELLFRMAADATELGVWELDQERDELWIDDNIRRMADLPAGADARLGELLQQVIHPDDRELVRRSLAEGADSGRERGVEYEHRMIGLRNRRVRWLAIKGRRVSGPDGRLRLIGTARDITQQKRQEQALRRANEALEERVELRTRENERIWKLSPDVMAVCRGDGTILAANPAWDRQLGWPVERLLEASLVDFVDPADAADAQRALAELDGDGSMVRFDVRMRHRDASTRWVHWTANVDKGVVYAIGRDISAERAVTEELAAANRELTAQIAERGRVEATLQQMQRLEAVGQLTSGVAHDFNNLLTVVLSNISLIRRLLAQAPESDPRVLQRLESMRSAAVRGATLTAQLLAFSRRQRLEPQVVNLNEVVLGMRDLLQTTMGGSVKLETDLGNALWPALVDPTQLELIILNLAINARDAMEVGGTLTLRTANLVLRKPPGRPEEPEPGEYLALSVADTGCGMSPEVLAKAFEPFFTTKEVGRGSGLGLAQVYGFAKQSGGGVRIDTRPGHGTAVHVFIPRAAPSQPAADEPVQVPDGRDDGSSRHTLLVVDDDASVREVTTSMLSEMGYRVVEAGSGAAAIETMRSRDDIDLVIADFAMPGMNGAEMARTLRRSHPDLRVLFFTGYVDLAALGDVPEEYVLQKPLREDELGQRLVRLLRPGGTH